VANASGRNASGRGGGMARIAIDGINTEQQLLKNETRHLVALRCWMNLLGIGNMCYNTSDEFDQSSINEFCLF
jgi:hypothetical protein